MPTSRRKSGWPTSWTTTSPPRNGSRASTSSGTTSSASARRIGAAGGVAGAWYRVLGWLRARDPGWGGLRRAARVAIVVPSLAAIAGRGLGSADATTFAVFGGFALLGLADFG